ALSGSGADRDSWSARVRISWRRRSGRQRCSLDRSSVSTICRWMLALMRWKRRAKLCSPWSFLCHVAVIGCPDLLALVGGQLLGQPPEGPGDPGAGVVLGERLTLVEGRDDGRRVVGDPLDERQAQDALGLLAGDLGAVAGPVGHRAEPVRRQPAVAQ